MRRQEEAVAEQRRALPLGGEVTDSYIFDSPSRPVTFAELFANDKDTLYLYNFMFIPGEQGLPLEIACPDCTSIIDGLDGALCHLLDRINVAIVAKSPITQFAAWGRERGWRHTPLYSSSRTTFNRDYNAETDDAAQLPVAHVFTRTDKRIHHSWSSELATAPRDAGQHPRHVDYMWPIWKILDLTPNGRGDDWRPRYRYDADTVSPAHG